MVRHNLLDSFRLKAGNTFNKSLLQLSLERQSLTECSCDGIQRHVVVKSRTIQITVDFPPARSGMVPVEMPPFAVVMAKFHLFGQDTDNHS